jgi:hypothetical protein
VRRRDDAGPVLGRIQRAFSIGPERPHTQPLVLDRIEAGAR